VNERRTVVGGGLIGHSTGRRSLSAVGGDTRVPPTVERDRRAWLKSFNIRYKRKDKNLVRSKLFS